MNLNTNQIYFIASLLKHKRIDPNLIQNVLLKNYIQNIDFESIQPKKNFDIEQICTIFTPDFSDSEKKGFGITFTPINLVKFMYQDVLAYTPEQLMTSKIADISVGNGAFFVGLIIYIKKQVPDFSVIDFIANNLFGYDIKEENIEALKLVLSLLAIYFDEDIKEIKYNLSCCDFIDIYLDKRNELLFDLVVGNPPYVKQQNIAKEYRPKLEHNFYTIISIL